MTKSGMDATFDFEAAGYQAPGDWARLHDLLLGLDLTDQDRVSLRKDTKLSVCAVLTRHGVQFNRRYDPKAAAVRNAA